MISKRMMFVVLLAILIVACQGNSSDETVVTPPVAPAATNTTVAAADTADSTDPPPDTATTVPTSAPDTPSPTETADPVSATPIPTDTPIPPTPTNTPIPETAVTSVRLVPVVSGLNRPVYMTHAFDERLFVVQQDGAIRIVQDGQVLPEPFLNIDPLVNSSASEQGLLSVAFHPRYGENGRFFVYYTDNNGDVAVSRYQVSADDPNRADPESGRILLTLAQPYANHNGGQLQFGPDGYLYVGLGDGGSANDPQNNGQNPNTLLGSILRLDVDFNEEGYAVPANNPFVNDDGKRNEIWAYGLRNPWRFSFDRLTGDLYIADVGQNLWEEIHVQSTNSTGGENYGWNIMEGTHCFQSDNCSREGLEIPVYEYQHMNGNCSVTGGYVYRGQQFIALYGNYFFGDYCSGNIWSLLQDVDGSWTANQVAAITGELLSSFGQDVNGELYVIGYAPGVIYQIQP